MDPLSKYIFKKAGKTSQLPVILMYHGTILDRSTRVNKYSINSTQFIRQIDLLLDQGWNTARIKDLVNIHKWPSKTIVLTFDDGFQNNYQGAYLPLLERGMCATWFVVTGCIEKTSTWLERKNETMLTRSQLAEMNANGMEIGAHSVHHPDLKELDPESTLRELKESKQVLEDIIEEEVVSFAYPYGRYSTTTVDCVQRANYSFACSVRPGFVKFNSNPFLLPRITVFASDTVSMFARKVAFASNEASWAQVSKYYTKRILSRV